MVCNSNNCSLDRYKIVVLSEKRQKCWAQQNPNSLGNGRMSPLHELREGEVEIMMMDASSDVMLSLFLQTYSIIRMNIQ